MFANSLCLATLVDVGPRVDENGRETWARISFKLLIAQPKTRSGHACGRISRMCATNPEGIVNFAALPVLVGNRAKFCSRLITLRTALFARAPLYGQSELIGLC